MDRFDLVAPHQPTGDQPQAIEKLVKGINNGLRTQTLLGVTGSGKTFTMANVIAKVNRTTYSFSSETSHPRNGKKAAQGH